jgi:hypothetical protein
LVRVALTAEQVVEYQVETAPPKPSDSRSRAFVERHWELVDELGTDDISAQLEALTPPQLQQLLRDAILEHLDEAAFDDTITSEEGTREDLVERMANL